MERQIPCFFMPKPWVYLMVLYERECLRLIKWFTSIYFLCFSKVWSMIHHGSVGWSQNKECYFLLSYTFLTFFCLFAFHNKICFYNFLFIYLFLMKHQISAAKYCPIRNRNWWSKLLVELYAVWWISNNRYTNYIWFLDIFRF